MDKQKLDKDAIKKVVTERIRAGDNYKQTRKFLDKSGIKYTGLKTTFYTWKNEIFPEDARTDAISSLKDKRKVKDEKGVMSVLTPKSWSKQKQKEADESVIADVLNEAVFHFIPCPYKGLKVEDVKEINVGGSIVGLIVYYTDVNLNHPLVIFVLRTIMLVLKVRKLCFEIREKVEEVKGKLDTKLHGGSHTTL